MTPDRWRQIENLYYAVQQRHASERAALLERADPEIRSRVERMLEVESVGQILDQPPDGFLADPTRTVLTSGAQLGPYKIEAQIGSGGMGTVYRAIDTRLGRVVAVKTASERYSERCQLEARAISTLNHPHVCTLYDVGPNYLVMEFIEGSTLAAEIAKGPLAPGRAARYGAQIASALAEAHALGIVHRDLKPSNVMVTRHGVKVLDFGLAKTSGGPRSHPDLAITETGLVMGTPAYMAPEQAEGRPPDSAGDLYSLGLVLYEMAAGRLPFPGASLGQMLASGLQLAVPAPSSVRSGVPESLDLLIARLLEKDPAKRPPSAADVARELAAVADRLAAPPWRIRSLLRPVVAVPGVILLFALATGAFWYWRSHPAPRQGVTAISPRSFTQLTSFTDSAVEPVLSPDGRMLAFLRSANPFNTPDQIWLKLLPDGEPVQITHDPRLKYNIAFTPDGTRIAYSALGDHLYATYVVSALGGNSELFLPNSAGLSWLGDGQLLFSEVKTGIHMGIVTARPDRSNLREIYFPAHDRGMAHYSYRSPDGKWILLAEMDPEWRRCRVVPFDGSSSGRQVGPAGGCTSAAWSPDGRWMYFGAQVAGERHLWRQRFPDGPPEQLTFGPTEEDGIAMAPDGRSLITSIFSEQNAVWVHDSHGDRAISNVGYAESRPPVFSADGKRLYYLLRRDSLKSPAELWRADLASGKSEVVFPGQSILAYDISRDEEEVVFSSQPAGKPSQLWTAPLDRSSPPRRITASGETDPYFGPDNEVLFRLTDGKAYYLGAVKRDGTGMRKAFSGKIVGFYGVSPDRRLAIVVIGEPGASNPVIAAVPLDGGPARPLCRGLCSPSWSPDGRYFYVQLAFSSRDNPGGQTAAIPIPPGKMLPPLPSAVVQEPEEWTRIPGVKIVEHDNIVPGISPSTYAYIKPSVHGNLFRVPLP